MRLRILPGITAATLIPLAANAITFIVQPGSALRLDFDLSGQTPGPPYYFASALLNFCCDEAGTYGGFSPGESFTMQAFSSDGAVSSLPETTIFPSGIGSGLFITDFPINLDPCPPCVIEGGLMQQTGYLLLTSPVLFELNTDLSGLHGTTGADIALCSPTCTPFVPATNITVVQAPVPLPAVGWLLAPAFGVIGWLRRKTVS